MDIISYAEAFGKFIVSLQLMRLVCKSIYKQDPNYDFLRLAELYRPTHKSQSRLAVLHEYVKRRAFTKP